MITFRCVLILMFSVNAVGEQLPDPLARTFAMRRRMKTGLLEYRITSTNSSVQDIPRSRNFQSRICGASYFVRNFGDDDGIMWVDGNGEPKLGLPFACANRLDLVDQDSKQNWSYIEGSYSAAVQSTRVRADDIRCIGLTCFPLLRSLASIEEDWTELFTKDSKVDTRDHGDNVDIRLERSFDFQPFGPHRRIFMWTLDKAKDFALIKFTVLMEFPDKKSRTWGQSETTYALIDKFWFPSKFRGWQLGKQDQVLKCECELIRAEFDRPNHPKKLTVDMLQIPAGAWIAQPGADEKLSWTGYDIVPREEWNKIRKVTHNDELNSLMLRNQKADEFKYPAWWYDASDKMGIADLESNPDAWEAYVRRWCMKNKVDDKQRTEAKSVLESSRKEARSILDKRAPELDKIEAQLKDKKLDPKKADEARAEGNRLLAPIGEIFNRLKTRLESLLLQKQIVSKQTTTAPAAKP